MPTAITNSYGPCRGQRLCCDAHSSLGLALGQPRSNQAAQSNIAIPARSNRDLPVAFKGRDKKAIGLVLYGAKSRLPGAQSSAGLTDQCHWRKLAGLL